jgi:hypothetical protein
VENNLMRLVIIKTAAKVSLAAIKTIEVSLKNKPVIRNTTPESKFNKYASAFLSLFIFSYQLYIYQTGGEFGVKQRQVNSFVTPTVFNQSLDLFTLASGVRLFIWHISV